MIRFACPKCQAVVDCYPDGAGSVVACPTCGQRIRVPSPPGGPAKSPPPLPPQEPFRHASHLEPHRGQTILALGILSLFVLPFVLGPLSWLWGNEDLRKMRAGQMDREGQSNTEAGRICGMIATIMSLVVLGLVVLYFVFILFCCGLGGLLSTH